MEKFQELILIAKRKLKIADHMLNVSYKLVSDPKIMLSAATSLYTAVESAMSAALEYERIFKKIPMYSDNFDSKYTIFSTKLNKLHEITKDDLKLVTELREISQAHKKSPVEFTRKDKFVIASDDYDLKTLEVEDIKKYISRAKFFINKMESIVNRNNGIFK